MKKALALLLVPWLLSGCTATFTNLTPRQMPRSPNNLYPVEVAFRSRQQSLRWDSIDPKVIVNDQAFPLRPVPMVKNRWEGQIPVPPGTNLVHYRFRFDFLYNAIGGPQPDNAISPTYSLKILD
ncbi:hypothetical protein [Limisphaera sp. 4302-co]|uniref:hypothetical protein n=1 Tax=Limisphaera sp. 4302-co TaxID=3400417 RepID=UPI003C24C618